MRGEDVAALVAIGVLALLLLLFAAFLGTRARRPPKRNPPKRTFEHGRRLARLRHVRTTDDAIAGMREVPVGVVLDARADDRAAIVVIQRRKNQPCPQAAGFLAGLFESAWAHEVRVVHAACAGERGGECRYQVERAAPVAPSAGPLSASGAPTGGASTRGSAGARRRSPRARAGGG